MKNTSDITRYTQQKNKPRVTLSSKSQTPALSSIGWRRGLGRGGAFLLVSPLRGPLPTRSSRREDGELDAALAELEKQAKRFATNRVRGYFYEGSFDYAIQPVQRTMSDETKPAYSPGLEGVIAGESAICWVDPNAGLLYRGYDIHELAWRASFEEVAWLLLHGELPTTSELASFTRQLAKERALPPAVIEMLRLTPAAAHPMDMLRTGVSMLAAFDPELNDHSHASNLRKATRLIAQVSTLITSGWRIAHSLTPVSATTDLGHAANFLYCLTGEQPDPWRTKIVDTILVLYADHEFNASTFSARVTAS